MNPFTDPTPGFAEAVFTYDTPAIVYDVPRLRRTAALLKELCASFGTCCYAVKANRHPRILRELAVAGFGADVASVTELALATEAYMIPIVATAPVLTAEMIGGVVSAGGTLYFDNVEQIRAAVRAGVDLNALGIRISMSGDYASFGFADEGEVHELGRELGFFPRRLHFHCGEVETCTTLATRLRLIADWIRALGATEIDLGGGYGVLSNDYDVLREAFAMLGTFARAHSVRLIFEFGKVLVARCGILVAGVAARKRRADRQVVVLDTSSFNLASLERRRYWDTTARGREMPTRIIGSSCFEGDVFASEVSAPPLAAGDKVAFSQFGAYTMSVAGSIHGLPLPREVFFET